MPDNRLLDSTIEIQCVHGDCVEYPLAKVDIAVDDEHFEILAGVAERLPTATLLSEDVPGLCDLLGKEQADSLGGYNQICIQTPSCGASQKGGIP